MTEARNPGHVLEHPCPECGGKMVLKPSKFGLFYGCLAWPRCDATHGAHRETGLPLGTPADKPTKAARIAAHAAFDTLWKGHLMTRGRAYEWMAETMGLTAEEAHIGRFTIAQCDALREAVRLRRGV